MKGITLVVAGLAAGEVTIQVYRGGNDHKVWMIDGAPLFVEKSFVIE